MRFLAIFWLFLAGTAFAAVGEADLALLKDAEGSRGDLGGRGIVWIVDATSVEKEEEKSMKLRVITQDSKVFAEILEPESSKGSKYIVADGKMWYHKPNLSRPVPISRRQRVIGKAAVGDIASMSFLDDYSVDSVEEGDFDGEACMVFTLVEESKAANYPKIQYWVSKERRVGVKAEFFTVSGARLRTATMTYDHVLMIEKQDRVFLSEMVVTEEQEGAKVTRMVYREHLIKEFPDEYFDYTKLTPDRLMGKGPGRK